MRRHYLFLLSFLFLFLPILAQAQQPLEPAVPRNYESITDAVFVCASAREEFYLRADEARVWFRRPRLDDSSEGERKGLRVDLINVKNSDEQTLELFSIIDTENGGEIVTRGSERFAEIEDEWPFASRLSISAWQSNVQCDAGDERCDAFFDRYKMGEQRERSTYRVFLVEVSTYDGGTLKMELRVQRGASAITSINGDRMMSLECEPVVSDKWPRIERDSTLFLVQTLNLLR